MALKEGRLDPKVGRANSEDESTKLFPHLTPLFAKRVFNKGMVPAVINNSRTSMIQSPSTIDLGSHNWHDPAPNRSNGI